MSLEKAMAGDQGTEAGGSGGDGKSVGEDDALLWAMNNLELRGGGGGLMMSS